MNSMWSVGQQLIQVHAAALSKSLTGLSKNDAQCNIQTVK